MGCGYGTITTWIINPSPAPDLRMILLKMAAILHNVYRNKILARVHLCYQKYCSKRNHTRFTLSRPQRLYLVSHIFFFKSLFHLYYFDLLYFCFDWNIKQAHSFSVFTSSNISFSSLNYIIRPPLDLFKIKINTGFLKNRLYI